MDCIRQIISERRRLDDRQVSPAFHLAVIEEALRFMSSQIPEIGRPLLPQEAFELQAACADALDAIHDLRGMRT